MKINLSIIEKKHEENINNLREMLKQIILENGVIIDNEEPNNKELVVNSLIDLETWVDYADDKMLITHQLTRLQVNDDNITIFYQEPSKQKVYEDDIELFSYNELYDILCNICEKLNLK